MALNGYFDVISEMIKNGITYMEISAHLQNVGVLRGASEANVRKFCREAGINHRTDSLSQTELSAAIETAIHDVRL